MNRTLVVAAAVLLQASCNTAPLECPATYPVVESKSFHPQTLETDVDLLFVVDNSNSMGEEQQKLATQFAKLIDGLRTPKLGKDRPDGPECTEQDRRNCKIPNVRIGVVSSDLGAGPYSFASCELPGGDGGRLQTKPRLPGCTPPKDPWISYTNGVTNIPASGQDPITQVKEAFSCIAQLGVGGCGFEHQLESARRALDPKVNPGFLRPEAYLAVVFITDEDDCSARRGELFDPSQQAIGDPLGPLTSFRCTEFGLACDQKGRQPGPRTGCSPSGDWLHSVDSYASFFAGVKAHQRTLLFAIAGPTSPVEVGLDGSNPTLKSTCHSLDGNAAPALRIATVVKSMGATHGFYNRGVDDAGKELDVNICSQDFGPALKKIGDVIVATLGEQCVGDPLLTRTGQLACRPGDPLPAGASCPESTLAQADCTVEESVGGAAASRVARCPAELFDPAAQSCGASCPCWRVVANPKCQQRFGSPYAIQVLREGNREPPKGTVAEVSCAASSIGWTELGAAGGRCR